jgi:hypothetical protein
VSQPDPSRNNDNAAYSKSSQRSQPKEKEQLEVGRSELRVYKLLLKAALKIFIDTDPGRIEENKIISVKSDIDKVKSGIKIKKYERVRREFSIDEAVVVYYLDNALAELNAILSLVRLFKDDRTSVVDKGECSRVVYLKIQDYKNDIAVSLAQFVHVPLNKKR